LYLGFESLELASMLRAAGRLRGQERPHAAFGDGVSRHEQRQPLKFPIDSGHLFLRTLPVPGRDGMFLIAQRLK